MLASSGDRLIYERVISGTGGVRATLYIHIVVRFSLFGKEPTFRSPTWQSHSRSDGAAIFEQSVAIPPRFRPYFMHLHAMYALDYAGPRLYTRCIIPLFSCVYNTARYSLVLSSCWTLNVGQPNVFIHVDEAQNWRKDDEGQVQVQQLQLAKEYEDGSKGKYFFLSFPRGVNCTTCI